MSVAVEVAVVKAFLVMVVVAVVRARLSWPSAGRAAAASRVSPMALADVLVMVASAKSNPVKLKCMMEGAVF